MSPRKPARKPTRKRARSRNAGSSSDALARMLTENVQPRPRRQGWHGGPTPVGALRGVTAEQALWRPGPGRHNIWELALHIGYWKYAVRRRLEAGLSSSRLEAATITSRAERAKGGSRFPRTPSNWPNAPGAPDEARWRDDIALLRAEHEQLVATIARVPVARYQEMTRGRRQWTVGELILGIAQHDAYHIGQIQLIKRLWSAKRNA